MPAITTMSPVEAGAEMFQRTKTASVFESRPISMVSESTEILDTDFEGESDYEPSSPKGSFDSQDSRRRSQTTISSYDEAPTPSPRTSAPKEQFEIRFRPVEGPKGPHLFRSSQASVEFDFDKALQMSPLISKEYPLRTPSAFTEETMTPIASQYYLSALDAPHVTEPEPYDTEAYIRSWSTQQVIDWMYETGIDASVIECFDVHDINGTVLLDLDFEDLKELDIPSFGKRHQLWNAICLLQGEDGHPSPTQTPFQDISRPCTSNNRRSPSRSRSAARAPIDDGLRSATPSGKKRRGRKPPKIMDVVTPAESVSIVAIEQLLPKPHTCAKGDRCAKWRKQQRQLEQLQNEHGIGRFPISPTKGGRIFIAGDPGNAYTAENMVPNVHLQPGAHVEDPFRPLSEAQPSVVASSDLLGPGQVPEFALHEDMLDQLESRDPQDNVKQFLNFQHLQSPIVEDAPPSPPFEMFPSASVSPYPAQLSQPALQPPRHTPGPHEHLRSLPKLDIPRSASAGPQPQTAHSICRSATASPGSNTIYRLGTPASEMDAPLSASAFPPQDPVGRVAAQSVPPNMQYRQHQQRSRTTTDWRRPSMGLPAVKEGEVFSPNSASASDPASRPSMSSSRTTSSDSSPRKSSQTGGSVRDPAHHSPQTIHFGYGPDCTHSGWMKKRKTRMLRHEWQDAHFRLKGTHLTQHANSKLSTQATDSINVDDYAVACSSVSSSNKLTAAMKALNISSDKKNVDGTAFAFQLVPAKQGEENRKANASGKTHHFAVNNKDERIDWMRELMLAKAREQKGKGYEVEVNGVAA